MPAPTGTPIKPNTTAIREGRGKSAKVRPANGSPNAPKITREYRVFQGRIQCKQAKAQADAECDVVAEPGSIDADEVRYVDAFAGNKETQHEQSRHIQQCVLDVDQCDGSLTRAGGAGGG